MNESTSRTAQRIGLIGPGRLGAPMALNLIRAGWPLVVHARQRASAGPLIAAGAQWAGTARELAAACDFVVTVVTDAPAVEQVLFGADGAVHGARPGTLVIDMTTVPAQASRDFATRMGALQVGMLDAPVSGDAQGAVEATLSITVGGPVAQFERARPLLETLGSNVVHAGDHGAGQVARSCNQIISAVTIEAVAEALTLARRLGADPERVRMALAGGFAASRVLDVQGARMLSRDFSHGTPATLHGRDMGIVLDAGHALGLDLPASALAAQQLNALVGAGEGDLDASAMIKVLERMIGETR